MGLRTEPRRAGRGGGRPGLRHRAQRADGAGLSHPAARSARRARRGRGTAGRPFVRARQAARPRPGGHRGSGADSRRRGAAAHYRRRRRAQRGGLRGARPACGAARHPGGRLRRPLPVHRSRPSDESGLRARPAAGRGRRRADGRLRRALDSEPPGPAGRLPGRPSRCRSPVRPLSDPHVSLRPGDRRQPGAGPARPRRRAGGASGRSRPGGRPPQRPRRPRRGTPGRVAPRRRGGRRRPPDRHSLAQPLHRPYCGRRQPSS